MAEATTTIINNGKDIYDIMDTALKIGLGALIGGVFSFITLKSNQKNEALKEKRAYKLKTLDEASIILEEYFKDSFNLLNCYYGFSDKEIIKKIDSLNKEELSELAKQDSIYKESTNKAQVAISKFNIIKLEELPKLIAEYDTLIVTIRNLIMIEKKNILTSDEISKIIYKSLKIKKTCHSKINQYFENLK